MIIDLACEHTSGFVTRRFFVAEVCGPEDQIVREIFKVIEHPPVLTSYEFEATIKDSLGLLAALRSNLSKYELNIYQVNKSPDSKIEIVNYLKGTRAKERELFVRIL